MKAKEMKKTKDVAFEERNLRNFVTSNNRHELDIHILCKQIGLKVFSLNWCAYVHIYLLETMGLGQQMEDTNQQK